MAQPQPAAPRYRIKHVYMPNKRTVPIVMQASNGPCPLLALANVLLLRGVISLPVGPPDVSEERLISVVAGHLLDTNASDKLPKGVSPEYAANLERNVADAVARLPKLTTGIDVNPRFHDCKAYEFTDEVAIFDLLNVPLLHGWLVDPQDEESVKLIGGSSYNELIAKLIEVLGDDAAPAASSPVPDAVTGSSTEAAAAEQGAAAQPAAVPSQPADKGVADSDQQPERSDASFERRLQAALALSISSGPHAAQQQDGSSSATAAQADDLRTPVVTPNSAAAAAFDSALVTPGHSRGGSLQFTGTLPGMTAPAPTPASHWRSPSQQPVPSSSTSELPPLPTASQTTPAGGPSAAQQLQNFVASEAEGSAAAASAPDTADQLGGMQPSGDGFQAEAQHMRQGGSGALVAEAPVAHAAAHDDEEEAGRQAVKHLVENAFRPHLTPKAPRDAQQVAEAQLIQEFLSTSQLTYHGLTELHQALSPGQLAVFFRNNHFSTLAKNADGALYLLVTDQGYLRESGIVWERLSGIDGDAQFYQADFTPYRAKASLVEQATALAQAAFAGHGGESSEKQTQGKPGEAPNTSADADLALALQMQEDEAAERARQDHEQRRQQQQQGGAPLGQRQQGQQQAGQQAQQGRQRPGSGSRSGRRQGVVAGQPPVKDKCTIM